VKRLLILVLLMTSVFAATAIKATTSPLRWNVPIIVGPKPPTIQKPSSPPIQLSASHQYSVEYAVNLKGRNKLTFTITPHGSAYKADIYIKDPEYHRIAEVPITNPNQPTTYSIVVENISGVMVHIPESDNPSISVSATSTSEPLTAIATETCNNGIGYSPNPTEYHCKASGYKDCCGWYQQYHVHDLQTNITDPVDIYIDFRIGWQQGCTDNVTVYTSDDNATWNLAGSTTATALDLDGNPVFPQVSVAIAVRGSEVDVAETEIEGLSDSGMWTITPEMFSTTIE